MNLTDAQLDRYARHIVLKEVGGAGQIELLESRVAVIGAGGLGSRAVSPRQPLATGGRAAL